MALVSRDLQATHEILSLFENSKTRVEGILDQLPLCFCIINQQGVVFRGNESAATLFQADIEFILGRNMKEIFSEEAWAIFVDALQNVALDESASTEVEIPVLLEKKARDYLWQISQFRNRKNFRQKAASEKLFCIVGKDISEMKKALLEISQLSKDLEVTGAVQSLLIPNEKTMSLPEVKLVSTYQPADQSGGDWLWYQIRPDKSLLVLLGDVTGHGAGSAMVTASVSGSYYTLQAFCQDAGTSLEIPKLFQILSQNLHRMGKNGFWMTMSAVEVYFDSGLIKFWNAGGPPVFLMKKTGMVEVLVARGTPLGHADLKVGMKEHRIDVGDRLFMFTDGAYEINMPKGSFNLNSLKTLFSKTRDHRFEDIPAWIDKYLIDLREGGPASDDTTLILLERSL